jgi:hypothetical protein
MQNNDSEQMNSDPVRFQFLTAAGMKTSVFWNVEAWLADVSDVDF